MERKGKARDDDNQCARHTSTRTSFVICLGAGLSIVQGPAAVVSGRRGCNQSRLGSEWQINLAMDTSSATLNR